MIPRPGNLTRVLGSCNVALYHRLPDNDVITSVPASLINEGDGLLLIIARSSDWIYVVTSSARAGWVYVWDVGPGDLAGAVYHLG